MRRYKRRASLIAPVALASAPIFSSAMWFVYGVPLTESWWQGVSLAVVTFFGAVFYPWSWELLFGE